MSKLLLLTLLWSPLKSWLPTDFACDKTEAKTLTEPKPLSDTTANTPGYVSPHFLNWELIS